MAIFGYDIMKEHVIVCVVTFSTHVGLTEWPILLLLRKLESLYIPLCIMYLTCYTEWKIPSILVIAAKHVVQFTIVQQKIIILMDNNNWQYLVLNLHTEHLTFIDTQTFITF